MTGNTSSTMQEIRPRKIKIETRFGKARCLRSRKDRPCDACRHRKSACIITVRPPCRFCASRGKECTFASSPTQRIRKPTGPKSKNKELSPVNGVHVNRQSTNSRTVEPQQDQRTPQPERRTRESQVALQSLTDVPPDSHSSTHVDDSGYSSNPNLSLTPTHQDQRIHSNNKIIQSDISSGNTLDGTKGLTAHFLGPSSDQDAHLLSSFRSNILNETRYVDVNIRQVFPEQTTTDLPPVHFNVVHDLFPERDNRMKEIASEKIEAFVAPHTDVLVRLYFNFIHPAFPVLSKNRFLREHCQNRLRIPASLRGLIYGLACPFWDRDKTLRSFPSLDQGEIFEHAHTALNRELDSPKLSTLQSCLLILHENPPLTGTTESPRNWTLACQATSCAQSLGLHSDPSLWDIPDWEKRLRKKLWWAAFVTDKFASLGYGSPSHIPRESFNTGDLTLEDILCGEDVTSSSHGYTLLERDRSPNQASALNFLETVRLAKQLSVLLDYSYNIQNYSLLPATSSEIVDHTLYALNNDLDSWYIRLSQCLSSTTGTDDTCTNGILSWQIQPSSLAYIQGPLLLAFFAVKSLLLRAIMSPATPLAKSNPYSNLRTHFDSTLEEFQRFIKFISSIKPPDLRLFWGRHSRTHLVHAGNFLIYLFLCASTVQQVEKSYTLLESYRHSLRSLASTADDTSMGLLRPALLRTESFFNEAIGIMRRGGCNG